MSIQAISPSVVPASDRIGIAKESPRYVFKYDTIFPLKGIAGVERKYSKGGCFGREKHSIRIHYASPVKRTIEFEVLSSEDAAKIIQKIGNELGAKPI